MTHANASMLHRNPLQIIGGGCTILLSVKALGSWMFPALPMLTYQAMSYSQQQMLFALLLGLLGATFLMLATGLSKASRYLSLAVATVASLLTLHAVFQVATTETETGRLTAISNALLSGATLLPALGIALLAGPHRGRRLLPILVGVAALLLFGLLALIQFGLIPYAAVLPEQALLAPTPPVILATATVALTLVITTLTATPEDEEIPSPWPASAAGFAVILVGYIVWHMMSHWQMQQYRQSLQVTAEGLALELSSLIEVHNDQVVDLADAAARNQELITELTALARQRIQEQQGFRYFIHVDRQLQASTVAWQTDEAPLPSVSLHGIPGMARRLGALTSAGDVLMLAQRTPLNPANSYLVFTPVLRDGERIAFAGAVIDMDWILRDLLSRYRYRDHLEGIGLQVEFGPIAGPKRALDERVRANWEFQSRIGASGAAWTLTIWPTPARLSAMRSLMPEITFVVSIAIMLFTVGLITLYRTTRLRTRRIRSINKKLSEEIRQRSIIQEELSAAHVALSIELERTQSILDNSTDIIVGIDHEGKVLSVNRAGEAALGYRSYELVGKHFQLLMPPPLRKRAAEMLEVMRNNEAAIKRGERDPLTILSTRDGERIYGDYTVSRVQLEEGSQFTVFIRDVTAQRNYEKELRKARLVAEEASKQKSSFLANMSHEIRTPMNGIIGMCALMQDTDLSAQQADCLRTIQGSADSLLSIINDILDFSKVEAGKLELEEIEFNLREELENLIDLLSLLSREKGIALLLRFAPGTPLVYKGDPVRIRQIITNFVNNAIKFTKQGHVLIDVSARMHAASRATLQFRIEDTGIGIPPEKFAEIFRDFTQADTSTTRQYGGTGLGLTIAKRLTEMMHGNISVDSQPGQGTSFTISLNLGCTPGIAEPDISALLFQRHVMLIDPSDVARSMVREQLESWHMKVDEYVDPGKAYARLLETSDTGDRYHLVIAEKNLPNPGGFSLGKQLHSDPELRATPLLMLTSTPQLGDGKRCRESGFHGYLPRPYHERDLHDVISRMLELDLGSDAAPGELVTRLSVAEERQRAAASGSPQSGQASGHGRQSTLTSLSGRVLLAEDNLVNQKVAKKMLEKLGCTVTIAANGEEAIEAWRAGGFDLILMDCQMPTLDGYDATGRIRQEEDPANRIPIVALTANAMSSDRQKCLDAGMDEHLAKPVKLAELSGLLERFLVMDH